MFYGSAKSALIQYLSGLRQKYNKLINIITVIPGYMLTKSFNTKTYNFLVLSPERSASIIVKAIKKKKEIVYVDYKWKFIMMLIKLIPEKIFKKLKF
jgi:short-subunit dehydrogenase